MSEQAEETERRPMPMPKWTGLAIFGLAIAAAFAITVKFGLGAALILLAGGALILFIWLAFRAVQSVTEPDASSLLLDVAMTPAGARKVAALKALRDLETERGIGNLSDEDYRELEKRYREEAKQAMRDVDEERAALRERAEALATRAVERALVTEQEEEKKDAAPEPAMADPTPTPAEAPISRRAAAAKNECAECQTKNDPDAKFCKQCGAKMGDAS